MSPLQISELIQTTALALIPNCTYLRATDQEANIQADNLDLDGITFVLYNNRPEVTGNVSEYGAIIEDIPVQISFLVLAELDDTDGQTDQRIDCLYGYAQQLFDKLSNSQLLSEYADGYTISLGDDDTKIYDKVMSGISLEFDLKVQRAVTC